MLAGTSGLLDFTPQGSQLQCSLSGRKSLKRTHDIFVGNEELKRVEDRRPFQNGFDLELTVSC